MKIKVPIFDEDFWWSEKEKVGTINHFYLEGEEFLDGPVTRRIAVLDFDPDTGALFPGARFKPPAAGRVLGEYEIAEATKLDARDLNQVFVFSAVMNALLMIEKPDALGRRLTWAFKAPQLLIVPRAGLWENAFYQRETHSLQFFYFENPKRAGEMVYTGMSRDIVSHEAGHAFIDAIAPDLYDGVTPQSLALHEGIADLVAVLTAFMDRNLVQSVLKDTNGSLNRSTAFSAVAEKFGEAIDQTGLAGYLRNLYNQKTLDAADTSLDDLGKPNLVSRFEAHDLSQVLSGALYSVLLNLHKVRKDHLSKETGKSDFSVSGKALFEAASSIKRLILRALDYLPPGDISFADYGRAIIAYHQARYPDLQEYRDWIGDEFVRRQMVPRPQALEVESPFEHPALKDVDLDELVARDGVAYQFAEKNRQLFGIPADIPFEVKDRLKTTKTYYYRGEEPKDITELMFKVWWYATEPNALGTQFPPKRRLRVGTTLAIDWETRRVMVRLTTDRSGHPDEEGQQRQDRDKFLGMLAADGILRPGERAIGPDGRALQGVIGADDIKGVMRVSGTARMLHIMGRK